MPKKTSKKKKIVKLQQQFVEASKEEPKPPELITGIHTIGYERYRLAQGVSKSMLDILADWTPQHLKYYLEHPEEPTPATRFGHILHRALLEPDTYRGAFHVKPKGMKFNERSGQEWRAQHMDLPLITFDEEKQITAMVSAVHTHSQAKRFLYEALTEQSLFVYDENGVLRKMRLDALTKGTVIPDVKTVADARLEPFQRSTKKYRYHVQAPYYLDGAKMSGLDKHQFVFILVEKDPPHLVRCLEADPDAVALGRLEYEYDLRTWMNILATGEWPGWPANYPLELAALPDWDMKQASKLPLAADGTEQIMAEGIA